MKRQACSEELGVIAFCVQRTHACVLLTSTRLHREEHLWHPCDCGCGAAASVYVSSCRERYPQEIAVQEAGCIEMDKEGTVETTMGGRIASYYYLKHDTMSLMMNHLHEHTDFKTVLQVLSSAPEYDELPVCTLPLQASLLACLSQVFMFVFIHVRSVWIIISSGAVPPAVLYVCAAPTEHGKERFASTLCEIALGRCIFCVMQIPNSRQC